MAILYRIENKKIIRAQLELATFMIGILEKANVVCQKLINGQRVKGWQLAFKQEYLRPMESEMAGLKDIENVEEQK